MEFYGLVIFFTALIFLGLVCFYTIFFSIRNGMKLEDVKKDIRYAVEKNLQEDIQFDLIGKLFKMNKKTYDLPCYIGVTKEHLVVCMMNATYVVVKNATLKLNLKTARFKVIKGLYKNQFMTIVEDYDTTLQIKVYRKMRFTRLENHIPLALTFLDFVNERAAKNHQEIIHVDWSED